MEVERRMEWRRERKDHHHSRDSSSTLPSDTRELPTLEEKKNKGCSDHLLFFQKVRPRDGTQQDE